MRIKHTTILLLTLITGALTMSLTTDNNGYQPGDVVTDFNLKNIDGEMLSLSDMEAKGFIVTFTCNHCPFSVAYEDRIIALDKKYRPLGYPVIAINPNDAEKYPDDSYENMIVRAEEKGFTFPYLVDESQEVAKAFGASRTPHMYVLEYDANGDLIVQYVGAIDNNVKDEEAVTERYVEDAVNALLAGEEIEMKQTKAVGCTIKWK